MKSGPQKVRRAASQEARDCALRLLSPYLLRYYRAEQSSGFSVPLEGVLTSPAFASLEVLQDYKKKSGGYSPNAELLAEGDARLAVAQEYEWENLKIEILSASASSSLLEDGDPKKRTSVLVEVLVCRKHATADLLVPVRDRETCSRATKHLQGVLRTALKSRLASLEEAKVSTPSATEGLPDWAPTDEELDGFFCSEDSEHPCNRCSCRAVAFLTVAAAVFVATVFMVSLLLFYRTGAVVKRITTNKTGTVVVTDTSGRSYIRDPGDSVFTGSDGQEYRLTVRRRNQAILIYPVAKRK